MPAAAPHSMRHLRLVVFASGTATMALQMCAIRLLAPWLGASTIVWATIIGLSLLAMSLGYLLGGRLADLRTDGGTLAATLLGAAVLVALVPVLGPLVLPHATIGVTGATGADLVGSAVGFGALFLLPALLLGVTPPYAIRLAIPAVDDAGRTAGRLYALSTVGSIVGTLLTALVLVQWIGTRATLLSIAVVLVAAALLARGVRPVVARAPGEHAEVASSEVLDRSGTGAGIPVAVGMVTASGIALVEGAALMATEMSVARLVGPFFGSSQAVWAVIIATVMGSIALGSRIGGRLADRRPTLGALAVLLSLAAVAVAVLPFAATPVMRLATGGIDDVDVPVVVGSFLATMLLLVVPITLLGAVPPWLLRLAVPHVTRAGRTAGRLYALSTAGALAGTFLSVLVLIPGIGTRRTMLLFAAVLALLALTVRGWSAPRHPRRLAAPAAALIVVAALLAAPTGLVKPLSGDRVLEERESRYQFIQVVGDRDGGRRVLQLNEGWAVHSIWDPATVLTGGIWDHFLVVPALVDRGTGEDSRTDRRMLVVGSAAGTSKRAFEQLRPRTRLTNVELDAEVTRVGRRWFALEGPVTAADGRPYLERTEERWDVIHVDAYRQPYIPFYLTTREFFELARKRLQPGGVVSINVGSTPEDPRINEAVAATMRDVFPFVARYRAEDYNEVIVGVDDPGVTVDELRTRIETSDIGDGAGLGGERQQLGELFSAFAEGMREVQPDPDRVLTDDRAPVEWMTDRMIFGAADS